MPDGAETAFSSDDIFTDKDWEYLSEELGFSTRQEQIARDLFLGMSDKQIAQALNISVATVRTHLGRMFTKYGVDDRSQLTLLCVKQFYKHNKGGISRHPH